MTGPSQPSRSAAGRGQWKQSALQLYRLGIVLGIAWLVHQQHAWLKVQGDAPVDLDEAQSFFPDARALSPDSGPRQGLNVLGREGEVLGYVVRTSPDSDRIIGYAGPTDSLVAFDLEGKVLGVRVRRTADTRTHLGDIIRDRHFLKTWNGMQWDDVANLDLEAAGIEGVSGATMTSRAIAEGITHRLKTANQRAATIVGKWRLRGHDTLLAAVVVGGLLLSFGHWRGRRRLRQVFQFIVIVYVGLMAGDLLAQSLLGGWAQNGIPWRQTTGLVLIMAAALIVPWTSGKPLYCQQICPHGAAQELLGRLTRRWHWQPPAALSRGLRWLPFLLLAVVVATLLLALPYDLAEFEPFDAYVVQSAGWVTITIAGVGLGVALFIPQGYCRYGCPTGALLEFVRSRGATDRFGRRDAAGAILLVGALLCYWKYAAIHEFLVGA